MSLPPMFIVQLNIDPAVEERWNEWYTKEHLEEVMDASSDIARATRFRRTGGIGDLSYATVYEFDTEAGLAAFMASDRLPEMGVDYERDWGQFTTRINHSYVPIAHRVRP